MINEIKEEILSKLKTSGARLSLRDLAKEFDIDLDAMRGIVHTIPEVETSEFNSALFVTLAKQTSIAASAQHNKYKGVLKQTRQMMDAMERCRQDRGGEFSNLSTSSKVGVYKNLA